MTLRHGRPRSGRESAATTAVPESRRRKKKVLAYDVLVVKVKRGRDGFKAGRYGVIVRSPYRVRAWAIQSGARTRDGTGSRRTPSETLPSGGSVCRTSVEGLRWREGRSSPSPSKQSSALSPRLPGFEVAGSRLLREGLAMMVSRGGSSSCEEEKGSEMMGRR